MLKRIAALLCLAAPIAAAAADEGPRTAPAPAGSLVVPAAAKAVEPWSAAPAFGSRPAGGTARGARACEASGLEMCLDAEGRLTVPGAKRFLPDLPGLTPERLTVKRSGIVLGYSF